jgi:hypothetical protein
VCGATYPLTRAFGRFREASHPADLLLNSWGPIHPAVIVTGDDNGDVTVAWGCGARSHNGAKSDDESSDAVHFRKRYFASFLVGW